MKQDEVEGDEAVKPNVCCVIADSLRWDVFVTANPVNILKLGKARKVYSIANSTLPALHGFLMNYPPIGIGKALFVEGLRVGSGRKVLDYAFTPDDVETAVGKGDIPDSTLQDPDPRVKLTCSLYEFRDGFYGPVFESEIAEPGVVDGGSTADV